MVLGEKFFRKNSARNFFFGVLSTKTRKKIFFGRGGGGVPRPPLKKEGGGGGVPRPPLKKGGGGCPGGPPTTFPTICTFPNNPGGAWH